MMKNFEELDDTMLDGVAGGSASIETDDDYSAWSDLLHEIQSRVTEDYQSGTVKSSALVCLNEPLKTCRVCCDRWKKMSGPARRLMDALAKAAEADPVFGDYIIRIKELLQS